MELSKLLGSQSGPFRNPAGSQTGIKRSQPESRGGIDSGGYIFEKFWRNQDWFLRKKAPAGIQAGNEPGSKNMYSLASRNSTSQWTSFILKLQKELQKINSGQKWTKDKLMNTCWKPSKNFTLEDKISHCVLSYQFLIMQQNFWRHKSHFSIY